MHSLFMKNIHSWSFLRNFHAVEPDRIVPLSRRRRRRGTNWFVYCCRRNDGECLLRRSSGQNTSFQVCIAGIDVNHRYLHFIPQGDDACCLRFHDDRNVYLHVYNEHWPYHGSVHDVFSTWILYDGISTSWV